MMAEGNLFCVVWIMGGWKFQIEGLLFLIAFSHQGIGTNMFGSCFFFKTVFYSKNKNKESK